MQDFTNTLIEAVIALGVSLGLVVLKVVVVVLVLQAMSVI